MSSQIDKETMNSLDSFEMDREVIRCKTCGLVQYRTRTGNCRRCVRALPQRLEFLSPPPAPMEAMLSFSLGDLYPIIFRDGVLPNPPDGTAPASREP